MAAHKVAGTVGDVADALDTAYDESKVGKTIEAGRGVWSVIDLVTD